MMLNDSYGFPLMFNGFQWGSNDSQWFSLIFNGISLILIENQ